jgi:small subunit ribosomal protein S2
MSNLTIKQLLEAGVHFGHQTKRWNPKMKPYIFGARNGIYIIDLQKTLKMFKEAFNFVKEVASRNEYVLFVGTKKQAQEGIVEEAKRCGAYYVNVRWLGGTLTNYQTIEKSIDRLRKYEELKGSDIFKVLPKKEAFSIDKEIEKLERNMGGIKGMDRLPGALYIVDPKKEYIAVNEAKKLGIPTVGICIETRLGDLETEELAVHLNHPSTNLAVAAERHFLKRLEGGCQVPIAAHGETVDGTIRLEGMVASVDGRRLVRRGRTGPADDPLTLGISLAEELLSLGAGQILSEVYGSPLK